MKKGIIVLVIVVIILVLALTGFILYQMNWNPKPPKIKGEKKHIACIGDSITFGDGVNKKEDKWEYFLEQKLGEDYQVLNYGLNGRTLLDEGDYPYRASIDYKVSKDTKADMYIIMLGTNDSKPYNWNKEAYKTQYDQFIKEYQALDSHPDIFIMTPPCCFPQKNGKVEYDIDAGVITREIVPFIYDYAETHDVHLIDLNKFTAGHAEWFKDGVHPNAEGNKMIAEYIYDEMNL